MYNVPSLSMHYLEMPLTQEFFCDVLFELQSRSVSCNKDNHGFCVETNYQIRCYLEASFTVQKFLYCIKEPTLSGIENHVLYSLWTIHAQYNQYVINTKMLR